MLSKWATSARKPIVLPPTGLVHDRAAGDVHVGGRHGARQVRGHESRDVADVGECGGSFQQRGLLNASDDVVASWKVFGEGLRHAACLQGDDADAVRPELAGPLSAQTLESVESDLEASQAGERVTSKRRPCAENSHVTAGSCPGSA